jgi:hypothetical protein
MPCYGKSEYETSAKKQRLVDKRQGIYLCYKVFSKMLQHHEYRKVSTYIKAEL